MNSALVPPRPASRSHIAHSVGAIVAGTALAIFLTVATDFGLQSAGLFPALGAPPSDRMLLLATVYRTLYGIIAGYMVARRSHPITR